MADSNNERCVLCLDEKRSPVRIHCGHSFCHECLNVHKSYRGYAWANKCPICRGLLKDKKRTFKSKTTESSVSNRNRSGTSNHRENITPPTTPLAAEEQSCILEEFIAIATDDYREEDGTPSTSETEDLSGMEYIDVDDDDDDDGEEGNFFTDSDEDSYYYLEEDEESWDQQTSVIDADEYEPEVVTDSEVALIANEAGAWSRIPLGLPGNDQSNDPNVVIVDDIILID